jgi:hypothetical protein
MLLKETLVNFTNTFGAKTEQLLRRKSSMLFDGNNMWHNCTNTWCHVQKL